METQIQLMDVKRQHEAHASEYESAVLRVLRSGHYIGGEEVAAFENEFASYMGVGHGIACGNGTDALILALRSLGIGDGDEVITTVFSFFATAESIAAVGAVPVFVDICADSYCMDVAQIEGKITEKTKAVLPVHLYGQSAAMDEICQLAHKHGLFVICDCAQAAGTKYHGRRESICGDVACFSFFPTKNLGAAGDGGIVVTDRDDVEAECRSLRVHGSRPDDKYCNRVIGYNSRLDAMQAALLRVKLKHLDEFVEQRRRNAAFYNRELKGTGFVLPHEMDYGEHSYYVYVLQHKKAGEIREKLKAKGIGTGVYFPIPLHLQEAFRILGYQEGDFPAAERLAKNSFAIPVYPELTEKERGYISEVMKNIERPMEGLSDMR